MNEQFNNMRSNRRPESRERDKNFTPLECRKTPLEFRDYNDPIGKLPSMSNLKMSCEQIKNKFKDKNQSQWKEEIIDGKVVQYTIVQIPIEKALLWADNPRTVENRWFAESVDTSTFSPEKAFEKSKRDALELLQNDKEITVLIQGIHDHGQPIGDFPICIPRSDGMYDIIEGNRRFAVMYLLCGLLGEIAEIKKLANKKELAEKLQNKPFPKTTSVKIYKDITETQVNSLLNVIHAAGKKDWNAVVRAKQIYNDFCRQTGQKWKVETLKDLETLYSEIITKNPDHYKDIFKKISQNQGDTNVSRTKYKLLAFASEVIFRSKYGYEDETKGKFKSKYDVFFSFFTTKSIRDMHEGKKLEFWERDPETGAKEKKVINYENPEILKDYMDWIAKGKVVDTVQVTDLPFVLSDDEARSNFIKNDKITVKEQAFKLNVKKREKVKELNTKEFFDYLKNCKPDQDLRKNTNFKKIMKIVETELMPTK